MARCLASGFKGSGFRKVRFGIRLQAACQEFGRPVSVQSLEADKAKSKQCLDAHRFLVKYGSEASRGATR